MLLLQDGQTALHYACGNRHIEIVKYLLTNGASVSATNKVNHKALFLLIVCLIIKLQNIMSCKFPLHVYNHM